MLHNIETNYPVTKETSCRSNRWKENLPTTAYGCLTQVPELSVDQVRDTYSAAYPEIATASLEGPEAVGNKLVYRFSRAIGSKG